MKRTIIPVVLLLLFCIAMKSQTKVSLTLLDGSTSDYIVSEEGYISFDELNLLIEQSNAHTAIAIPRSQIRKFIFSHYEGKTGQEIVDDASFSIYPNPATDYIKVFSTLEKICHVSILSLTGKVLYTGVVETNQRIDISSLPHGIYMLIIDSKTTKFVKL